MSALVPIPWQPGYFLTPDTLTMLQLASAHAGHNIPVSDAWRSYAAQKSYWDAYQAYLRGGPYAAIASNPDTGQRNHMRGAAVDIQNRADRGAMLAVGFTPDADEWWHFNNPRWASMPIIPTNTVSAGSGAVPIEEDDLSAQAEQQINAIFNAIFNGGTSMPDQNRSIGASLAGIVQVVDRIDARGAQQIQRTVNGKVVPNSQIQELADVKTLALNLTAQVGALQQALASLAVGQGMDPAAITKAAQEGAEAALKGITLKAVTE